MWLTEVVTGAGKGLALAWQKKQFVWTFQGEPKPCWNVSIVTLASWLVPTSLPPPEPAAELAPLVPAFASPPFDGAPPAVPPEPALSEPPTPPGPPNPRVASRRNLPRSL